MSYKELYQGHTSVKDTFSGSIQCPSFDSILIYRYFNRGATQSHNVRLKVDVILVFVYVTGYPYHVRDLTQKTYNTLVILHVHFVYDTDYNKCVVKKNDNIALQSIQILRRLLLGALSFLYQHCVSACFVIWCDVRLCRCPLPSDLFEVRFSFWHSCCGCSDESSVECV